MDRSLVVDKVIVLMLLLSIFIGISQGSEKDGGVRVVSPSILVRTAASSVGKQQLLELQETLDYISSDMGRVELMGAP